MGLQRLVRTRESARMEEGGTLRGDLPTKLTGHIAREWDPRRLLNPSKIDGAVRMLAEHEPWKAVSR